MLPLFANPAGLWVLLGLPVIVVIHFLQQRARVARTSTWFLIEKLAPDSARGRTWERLRTSRTFWLQLAAIAIASWVIAEPRWLRSESAQTVVIVLDASASMAAFRAPALAAGQTELERADGLAARTTWILMTTDPRAPALYRGEARETALEALERWQPELGTHDPSPALRLARTLAAHSGRTLFITDRRAKVPPDQPAVGVGRSIDNVGFAGATIARTGAAMTWRALVKNHSMVSQRRNWHLRSGTSASPTQKLEIAAGALTELTGEFPRGTDRVTIVLSADEFTLDDQLPLIMPRPKPLAVSVEGNDAAAEFFRKLVPAVDGATLVAPALATLRIAQIDAAGVARENHGGIYWPTEDRRAHVPILADPVTAEHDALVDGLNWQGWIGTGPYGFSTAIGDTTLLWHGRWPLVYLRMVPARTQAVRAGRQLLLAFDWNTSNAARLPGTVLLARRFLEAERDAQSAPWAGNFDCGSAIALSSAVGEVVITMASRLASETGEPKSAEVGVARGEVRAPARAAFFTVRRDNELLVEGAAQFADPRQGDFQQAEHFVNEVQAERGAAIERNTTPDPLRTVWLILLGVAVLGSWWPAGHGSGARRQLSVGRMPVI